MSDSWTIMNFGVAMTLPLPHFPCTGKVLYFPWQFSGSWPFSLLLKFDDVIVNKILVISFSIYNFLFLYTGQDEKARKRKCPWKRYWYGWRRGGSFIPRLIVLRIVLSQYLLQNSHPSRLYVVTLKFLRTPIFDMVECYFYNR